MNIKKMVDMLLLNLSTNHKVFYMEQRTYKDSKVFKHYKVKIDNESLKEFNSLTKLLLYLKER